MHHLNEKTGLCTIHHEVDGTVVDTQVLQVKGVRSSAPDYGPGKVSRGQGQKSTGFYQRDTSEL